jgi:hypothetical protein
MSSSAARRGRNEALFREVNDRIADMSIATDLVEFICECGDKTCLTTFRVEIGVYRDVREHEHRFLVAPGHSDPAVETVVLRRDDFVVVEKHGVAAEVADDAAEGRQQPA